MRVRAMTQPSFAVGIVVSVVSWSGCVEQKNKEVGDGGDGDGGGGGGEPEG